MKPSILPVILACSLALAHPLNSPVNSQEQQFICSPQDLTDCYPKVFIPTNEWQPIKPGQDIPGGLHVRLNIDTLQREAKLMDSSENLSAELVTVSDETQIKEPVYSKAGKPKKKDMGEISDFDSAVLEVKRFKSGRIGDIDTALDVLIELSHDIEFGIRLTADPTTLTNLNSIFSSSPATIQEKIYRIISSSLRNNPEAIQNVVKNDDRNLVNDWIDLLESSDVLVRKRALGILQALLSDPTFKYKYISTKFNIIDRFISIYPNLDESSKVRLLNILEDLKLVDEDGPEDLRLSQYIQNKFLKSDFDTEDQFKLYYQTLVELHKKNRDLKGGKEFVAWLDEESGKRHEGLKQRDLLYSDSDKTFDSNMLRTRHTVFGNPNAYRKHFDDEL